MLSHLLAKGQVFGTDFENCVRQAINKFLSVHFDSFIHKKREKEA